MKVDSTVVGLLVATIGSRLQGFINAVVYAMPQTYGRQENRPDCEFRTVLNRGVLRAVLKEEDQSEWLSVLGKLFQTDGPVQEKDLSFKKVIVFTRGATRLQVSDADCNCPVGV